MMCPLAEGAFLFYNAISVGADACIRPWVDASIDPYIFTCTSRSLRHQLKSRFGELLLDLLDLGGIAGLQPQLEEAAGDGHVGITAVVVDADHIGAAGRDNVADQAQLARLVLQGDHQVGLAATHDHTAGDNAGQDVHINVAAGDQADGLFACQRQLVEQCGRHRRGTGPLGHQLLVLHQRRSRPR